DDGSGNAVCRQQTLGAPEPLVNRDPDAEFINTGLTTPITPTQAQIDACVPLDLFGPNGPSAAAIDYVTAPSNPSNKATQLYGAASLGGTIVELPAGPWSFSSQFEWRRESNEFTPGPVFGLGLGRSTLGQASEGTLRFFEGGTEFIVPVFGGDVRPFGFNELELNGAVRVVNRSISSDLNPAAAGASSPTDVTFTAGGRWSPFEGITFRGNRTRSVRSPSVVELVGAGVTGFTGGADADFACDATNVDTDVSGVPAGTRRANCRAWVIALGLATDNASADTFLNGFEIPNTGSRPAAGGSNANLDNERADNWTVGVVLQPDFIPGLTIESDWYSIDVKGLLGLTFIVNQCFDQTTFPNSPVGGFNACDSVIPNVSDGMGGFIVPTVHPITGTPVPAQAQPGSPAISQTAGHNAFIFFPTVNQGLLESRAWNNRISYNFELADIFGGMADSWGDATVTGNVLYYRRLRTNGNEAAGEHTAAGARTPKYASRLDFTHRLGDLTHTLQWFRQSGTQQNVGTSASPTSPENFFLDPYNTFNYNVRYEFNDNITARLVVNNLTNNFLNPEFGQFIGDPIGRRFVGSVEFNF
ncbi:MAG: TonB-dependent receptor, partial [Pseudomonadota bacterium]